MTEEPHPTRQRIVRLFADGRERTVTDVCTALKQKGRSRFSMVRTHMTAMVRMGVLEQDKPKQGISIYRRADA